MERVLQQVIKFFDKNKRLPYLKEDNFIFYDEETESERSLRALMRIEEAFGTYKKLVDLLFDEGYITTAKLATMLGSTPTRVDNIIHQSVKNPDICLRRGLHRILGIDFYENKLTPYNEYCLNCSKKCKQWYYVDVYCKKKK